MADNEKLFTDWYETTKASHEYQITIDQQDCTVNHTGTTGINGNI